MAFRRVVFAVLGVGFFAGCGALSVLAWRSHLYASVAVLGLIIAWGMVDAALSRWPRPTPLPKSETQPVTRSPELELGLVRSLLDHTPAPLVSLGQDGVLHAANRAARRLFATDDRIVDPQPDLRAALARSDPGRRLTITMETPQGPHAYAVSITDLIDARGPSRLAALVDIQPEIRAAEASAMRDLMQVLSHEIMNALTPVASLAATARDLLSDEKAEPLVQAREAVEILARRAEGLTRFVDAYRSLARLPAPNLAPVSVGALLDETGQLFRGRWAAAGVSLTLEKPSPDIILDLDRDLMVHALSNILSNGAEAALEADPCRAAVTVSARFGEGGPRITISDTGRGVSPGDADAIFRPFFTTKPAGSGIGLSFASQVVASHGGKLALEPFEAVSGATFVLRF